MVTIGLKKFNFLLAIVAWGKWKHAALLWFMLLNIKKSNIL